MISEFIRANSVRFVVNPPGCFGAGLGLIFESAASNDCARAAPGRLSTGCFGSENLRHYEEPMKAAWGESTAQRAFSKVSKEGKASLSFKISRRA